MKYSVGYSLIERNKFISTINSYSDSIEEVYFAWPNIATGRLAYGNQQGYIDWQAQEILEHDLLNFKKSGFKLNLLFNGNCYGEESISLQLQNKVCSILEHLENIIGGINSVTTCSPFIAHIIKDYNKNIEVRASVNMRIGTIEGMKYLADLFDSFCMQREYNRDLNHIKTLKKWADQNNKNLTILVNSGCLNFCSNQTFHDNLVAHEAECSQQLNYKKFNPVMCWQYLSNSENHISLIKNSNWIRPEDTTIYENLFPVAKIATRLHSNPAKVIGAYVKQTYSGNLLELLEPGLAKILHPLKLDNTKFPTDWLKNLSNSDNILKEEIYQRIFNRIQTTY